MMSSMIYTQGHIGEEMYKLPESLTVRQFEDKNLTGINVKNVKDQAVFLPFLSPIYFTVSITVKSRSCDTTTCQLALNGGTVVQFTLTDIIWTALVMQTPKQDTEGCTWSAA